MKKIKILDRIKAFFSDNTERVKIPLYGSWQHFENSEEFNNSEVLNYKIIDKEGFNLFEIPLEHAVAIYYDNESMLPSIKSGWVALIDRSKIEFINNEVYAVILNNRIEFRILQNSTSGTKIKLIPENKNFEIVELAREDVNVLGKIEYILGRANINFHIPIIDNNANITNKYVLFSYSFVRALFPEVSTQNIVAFKIADSQLDIFKNDNSVLIDLANKQLINEKYSLFKINGTLKIFKIQLKNNNYILLTDNESITLTDDITIVGKLIWLFPENHTDKNDDRNIISVI